MDGGLSMLLLLQIFYGVGWSFLVFWLILLATAKKVFHDINDENFAEQLSKVTVLFLPVIAISFLVGYILSLLLDGYYLMTSLAFWISFLICIGLLSLLFFTKKSKTSTTNNDNSISNNSSDNVSFDDVNVDKALMGDSPIANMCYQNEKGESSYRPIIVRDVFYSYDKDVWYMKAIDKDVDRVKTFRLDRVISLECNGHTYYDEREIRKLADELSGWV